MRHTWPNIFLCPSPPTKMTLKAGDLRSGAGGAVNGPYGDSEFVSCPEVRGVRFMKPEEAWEFTK